jgi:hypothetical protein
LSRGRCGCEEAPHHHRVKRNAQLLKRLLTADWAATMLLCLLCGGGRRCRSIKLPVAGGRERVPLLVPLCAWLRCPACYSPARAGQPASLPVTASRSRVRPSGQSARFASLSPPGTGSLMLRHRRPPPHNGQTGHGLEEGAVPCRGTSTQNPQQNGGARQYLEGIKGVVVHSRRVGCSHSCLIQSGS